MVILRIYEPEKQSIFMEELLCKEILGISGDDLRRKNSVSSLEDYSPRFNKR